VFEAGSAAEVLAHHLHTTPVPPSQRTARPIPRDLEDIILRCLQKDKNDRPADARTMQHELSRCAAAGSWRREDAAGWWRRFRESDAASSSESVSVAPVDAEAVTVTVDLASRLPVSGS
jgi:serine/threonine-protein kinase